jgi:hypothetical protein
MSDPLTEKGLTTEELRGGAVADAPSRRVAVRAVTAS